MIFELLLFLVWSVFFLATLLGVWNEPQKSENPDFAASSSTTSTTSAMEIANQLW